MTCLKKMKKITECIIYLLGPQVHIIKLTGVLEICVYFTII